MTGLDLFVQLFILPKETYFETSVKSAYLTVATGAQNKDILLLIARVNYGHLSTGYM